MPTALAQLGRTAAPVPLADAVALAGFLDLVPDPRGVRGRRYRLSALVAVAAASVLAGARSLTAITEWISDLPAWACRVLGFPTDPFSGAMSVPHPHTLRRLLVQLDGDALDRAIGAFLTARATPAGPGLRAIAVDGKALRGSRTHVTGHVTLLAAMDHTGHVLAQRQVADKSNEIPAFRAPAGQRRPDRHGHHRRGAADPARSRHLPPRARRPLHRPGQGQPSRSVRPRPPPALARDHARPLRPHPGPPPPGDPAAEDRRLRPPRLPRRTPGPASRALEEGLHHPQAHHRARLPDHQPAARRGYRRPSSPTGSEGTGRSKIFCTTSARSARTTPKSMPAISRASWQACATSPSASTAKTVTPTSPPPYATPLATGEGP